MDRAAATIIVILLMGVLAANTDALKWREDYSLECPFSCHCSKATTDPSFLKTDCSENNYWLVPVGVSEESTHVNFADNKIVGISRKYMTVIKKVKILDLARNNIDYLPNGVFSDLMHLEVLDLSGNQIGSIKGGVFNGLPKLSTLYLGENRISKLESSSFHGMPGLQHLWLSTNRIWDLPHNIFHGLIHLKALGLSVNKLTKLNAHLLKDAKSLEFIFLQNNEIKAIPDYFFQNATSLRYVFLNDNNLTKIGSKGFRGASKLDILTLSNNYELTAVEPDSFNYVDFGNLSLIYILQTALVRVEMKTFRQQKQVGLVIAPTDNVYTFQAPGDDRERLREGLARNGFTCNDHVCTPCHFGTYQKRASDGSYVCAKCPPGGFYQNTLGHHGTLAGQTGCLPCPKGTYVEIDKFPGTHPYVCRVCPAGSKTDEWASYRGCFCIDSFYRKGRFTRCQACPKDIRGVLCNETLLLKEGFWWQFRDYNESWEYQRFVDAVMVPDEHYNHKDVNFTGLFPRPHPCPKASSCLGALNSVRQPCKTGYGGILCEVCVKGYYKSMSRCAKCPTLPVLITQMFFIACAVLLLIFILVRDERKAKSKGRTLSDVVLARLKIVIAFYQVTAGTLDAFSYVQWPETLLQLSNYAKFFQLNLVQMAPLHCFKDSLKMNAYVGLLLTVALNGGVIVLAFVYFQRKKLFIMCKKDMTSEEKKEEISLSKEHCYRSAFLVMFVTYPEASSRILRMLPPACQKICQDLDRKDCTYYLKMDYSLKCFSKDYNKYVIAAYVGSIYPVLFPLFIVTVLYLLYYRPHIKNRDSNPDPKRYEIVEGMRFMYENYDERCWYWEIVEMVRKLILTSGLVLLGAEGRIYIGMVAMASGFYAVAHAQAQPIPDKFEHLLQLASLLATFFNLSVGVLLRIPTEMLNFSIEKDRDSIGVTILLVTANAMVIGMVVVRYLMTLGQSLYAVYKNPQCSWQCFLSVILSAQDSSPQTENGDEFAVTTMEMTTDEKVIKNVGAGSIDGKETDNDSAVSSSVCDGSESPRGSLNSSGSKQQASEAPKDDSTKVPEVEFKTSDCKTSADHPTAATNIALDSDDVVPEINKTEAVVLDIPDPMGTEAATKKPESPPNGDGVKGRCNSAMDTEDGVDTAF
ncbi:uncharacterized protein LOC144631589 isoform X1 [Oculina patagonica]